MIKKALFISLFLNSVFSFSQEIISSTAVDLKRDRDVFQVVNDDKKQVTLFVSDKVKVKAIQLNEKMQIVDSISAERPNTKNYSNMIGYNSSDNNTRLFWTSAGCENIFAQLFDFKEHKITTKEYSLVLKNEKILQKFSSDEKFYILTVLKNSNNFKLHIFDSQGNYKEQIIALEGFHFFQSNYVKSDLYGVFGQSLMPLEWPFTLTDVDAKNPASLTTSAAKRKCYFTKKQLIITIDLNVNFTQAIVIDLEKYTGTEKIVKSPPISNTSGSGFQLHLNSNSFLLDDKLYQIKTSSDTFYFTIKDLDGNIVQEYDANADKQIDFKNSEISLENGDFMGGKRTLENSSQFIRKINNLYLGVACYHIGENTLVTFGGITAVQQTGTGQAVANQFGLLGSLIGSFVFNPTMNSFNSYANRKVVKTEGLFDKEGKHITGDLQPLAFDKIRTFFDDNNDVSSQTLFKTDAYYLGYYDNKTKEYIIRKFAD
ncbi:hypothetical protein GKZ90_0019605 [Flavobacterium sp. MC2016-06]|jgi:hypothetical protein|uniref:hypothetical protein n=1 Tax=Flavobacterium sp. MC2016-06 TaxID=2676308 RepID=UPI0012BABE56|nr:hypothetical protein [Flavobacterium sp. MC2016-06]MBU3861427.1 hypothetical protein [Flavobacterium sp. MC2016-06]